VQVLASDIISLCKVVLRIVYVQLHVVAFSSPLIHIHAIDMAVFDALRHLSNYLYDAYTQDKHHLADLYELVQYAGNIIPRLYLMITVGSVYMSIPDAPIKEIMKEMT
jgi:hypothetical protein